MKKIFNPRRSLTILLALTAAGMCAENGATSIAPPGMIIGLLALDRDISTAARPKYLSPSGLVASPDGQYLYVAEQTAKQIAVVNLTTKTVDKTIKLPNEVTGIAVSPDGKKLYATCSSDFWPDGMACEVDIAAGRVSRRLPAGHGARNPVISHDGKTLYICNQHGDDIYIDDIGSGALLKKMYVFREPYSAAITPDDQVLVVANCLPVQKATDNLNIASKVLLISTVERKISDTLALPTGSHSVFGVTVSPDGNYAFATHLIAMFTLPATKIDGGWIHTNNFAVIDLKTHKLLNDFCMDNSSQGSANPWAIGCTEDNNILCVSHSGTSEFSIIDMKKMLDSAKVVRAADTVIDPVTKKPQMFLGLSHNLSVLRNIMWKKGITEKAPRSLAIIGTKAYTAGYFGDDVEIYDLALGDDATIFKGKIKIGPADTLRWTAERAGEFHYFSADLCYQGWQSCQSCHPLTRTDGLNWILAGDVNAPKNAKSMLYSWWTQPTGWAGKRANAWESIRYGMKNELFIEPVEAAASMMDTFFMKMKPVPSPHLIKGRLSPEAKEGKQIFLHDKKADCSVCHPGPLYADLTYHNSGVDDPYDATINWDTPTMVETWRGAPYGHLGSFDQLVDILKFGRHSKVAELPADKFDKLMKFILSL